MINKNLRKSLASRNVNEILIRSWNNPPTESMGVMTDGPRTEWWTGGINNRVRFCESALLLGGGGLQGTSEASQ